nr:putative retrotransposon protein [Tanacetum cinerariifolium]
GFTQTYGVDYEETFSPVADIRAIRILIAIAAYYDYEIWQMDVKTAFFNRHLFEEVYMEQPQGFVNPKYPNHRMQNIPYASAVGSIMYAVRCTRPDVAFVQNMTSRFQQNPGEEHLTVVKIILKYLHNTKDMFLVYGGNMERELRVSCYTDAGYLTNADNLKSQTRYVFILNGGAVDWKSTKQSIFATSFTYAEYIAFVASKEAVWIRKFISGLSIVPTIKEPINMYCDNTGAITIAKDDGVTKGARYFQAKVHYLRETIKLCDVKIEKIDKDDNLADPFTKALAFPKHSELTRNIGLLPASSFIKLEDIILAIDLLCVTLDHDHSHPFFSKLLGGGWRESGSSATVTVLNSGRRGKGRSIDEGEAGTERISDDSEELARVLTSMDAATILAGGIDVPTSSGSIPTAGPPVVDVPTGSDVVPTASPIVATATVVTPYSRRKGQKVMVESDTPKKQMLQEQIDAQVARELEEQQEIEDKRMTQQIVRDAEVARIHAEEELQGMIDSLDRTNETIAKNNLRWKVKDFKGMTFEEIKAKFAAIWKQVEGFIPIGSKEEAERLKRKGFNLEQEKAKKQKTSEEVPDKEKSPEEIPKEKVKEMISKKIHSAVSLLFLTLSLFEITLSDNNLKKILILVFNKWYQSLVRSFNQQKNHIQAHQKKKMIKKRSSSENKPCCSKACKKNTDNLNSKITELSDKLDDKVNMIYHYSLGLSQVEGRLVEQKERELKYIEKIKALEYYNESYKECIETLKKKLKTLQQEKERVDGKLAGLLTASKDLDNLIESQRSDKNKEGLGYSAVPPPIAHTLLPRRICLGLVSLSLQMILSQTIAAYRSTINKVEAIKKPSVKYVEIYRRTTNKPNVRGNQKNWKNLKSYQLGPNFVMKKKACFNCGDFNHLAHECRKMEKKGTSRSHNKTHESFTPRPVAHRPYRHSQRPVRTNMNDARPNRTTFNKQAHSYANRPFQRTSAVRPQYRAPWVPTVNGNFPPVNRILPTGNSNISTVCCCCSRHVNNDRPKAVINRRNWVNDIKASACWVWKPVKSNSASIANSSAGATHQLSSGNISLLAVAKYTSSGNYFALPMGTSSGSENFLLAVGTSSGSGKMH